MKNKVFRRLFAVLLALCLLCLQPMEVFADTDTVTETETAEVETAEETFTEPYIMMDGYKLSDDRLIAGESFTLTMYLKNYSTTKTAKEVLIDISNPTGVVPVYGTVSQLYIGDIAPQETREVSFDYDTLSKITSETLEFSVTIVSSTKSNYIKLRVPVGSDNVFSIISSNMAEENFAGLSTSASLSFRVLGEDSIGNIELRVEYNGETIGRSQIGSVTSGMTKTQSVSFVLYEPGEYALDFYLDYVSEGGKSETEFLGSKMISVKEYVPGSNSGTGNQIVEQPVMDDNVTVLLLGGLLILAIFAVAVFIIKKKR